jgi:hypothetical protein
MASSLGWLAGREWTKPNTIAQALFAVKAPAARRSMARPEVKLRAGRLE